MCDYYEHENAYKHTYDFGKEEQEPMILDENGYCFLKKDIDEFGNIDDDFDRNAEHPCCSLGMIQTALVDQELQTAKDLFELYDMFNAKYMNQK